MSGRNPFLDLFSGDEKAEKRRRDVEDLLGITDLVDRARKDVVYIPGFSASDISSLEYAVFERVTMDPSELPQGSESRPFLYLSLSYFKIRKGFGAESGLYKEVLLNSFISFLREPTLLPQGVKDLSHQLSDIFTEGYEEEEVQCLLNDIVRKFRIEEADLASLFVNPFLGFLNNCLKEEESFKGISSLVTSIPSIQALKYFVKNPELAECFLLFNFPHQAQVVRGIDYASTILGQLMSRSCIPGSGNADPEYFENRFKFAAAEVQATENQIWFGLRCVRDVLYDLLKFAMKQSPRAKHLALLWIGNCLKDNEDRCKIWTTEQLVPSFDYVSDGFMMNLSSVLLKFCDPFTSVKDDSKILKIDPAYCSINHSTLSSDYSTHVYLEGLHEETTLIPREDDKLHSTIEINFNFMTHLFFLTHKSLQLGFRVVHDKLLKLNRSLVQMENLHRDYEASPEAREGIQKRMEEGSRKLLCMKSALIEPEYLSFMMRLTSSTSTWATLKISCEDNVRLRYIPELVVENICEHLLVLKRFEPQSFEDHSPHLSAIAEFILDFMGFPDRMKNPHLRARLAECLECLLPTHDLSSSQGFSFKRKLGREFVFSSFERRLEIVEALLNVFVSIEATGEAVQFEQKFAYRKPIYDVMTYIWEKEEFRNKFVLIADEAEQHIEDENPPIFLRFVNLLINDANFLLDEALIYMKQIQESQSERPSWISLPSAERSERESEYRRNGVLAQYHNMMGTETIRILVRLTGEIKSVFTHSTLADRIAGMLNHFLKNLVGPDRKSFKVKNLEEYNFKPAEIVTNISRIYVNFSNCPKFLSAVSKDGRSYSNDLFNQAENVLERIGEFQLQAELSEISKKVSRAANSEKEEEELYADPPEKFLDPIMSILMKDPVVLPGSGQTVDKSTIARHLLSDQSDPFNRMPLTMDKVIPNISLKKEIHEWMRMQRENRQT